MVRLGDIKGAQTRRRQTVLTAVPPSSLHVSCVLSCVYPPHHPLVTAHVDGRSRSSPCPVPSFAFRSQSTSTS
ncbi:hypothetical protein BD311DRAFT_771068 [Dichomitus squalens]|uniref:Uncharacterized protein n=1 Tax=Dichomitus squalens TaxID=114155 RepID=A0A4Q9M8X1_9APHY|nr:hypothetical protein BD311DRAFT_771068 [Dichomitus squalens]